VERISVLYRHGYTMRDALPATGLVLLAAGLSLLAAPAAEARERFDVDLFARVHHPGPEGIAISRGGTVFVGTNTREALAVGEPRRSQVFAYDGAGQLRRTYTIRGQDRDDPDYGLLGMAFDGDNLLYVLDTVPPRVIRLNPRTGGQVTYARFRDVPPCEAAGRSRNCSETDVDGAPAPDYPVFGPNGEMYVTDINQALIWRVPRGGGRPSVWFTEAGLETLYGPNGIQFTSDGRTLLFALTTESNPFADPRRTAGLYKIRVRSDGRPGRLRQFWESPMDDAPDGFAIARSGNVYVALAGPTANAVAVISPRGEEIARIPPTEVENQLMEVPFDQPASAAFLGKRVLVTNQSVFLRNPAHWAVLDVFADERGLPLFRPVLRDPDDAD
jgi:sugar lactone lactonase YvrE